MEIDDRPLEVEHGAFVDHDFDPVKFELVIRFLIVFRVKIEFVLEATASTALNPDPEVELGIGFDFFLFDHGGDVPADFGGGFFRHRNRWWNRPFVFQAQ